MLLEKSPIIRRARRYVVRLSKRLPGKRFPYIANPTRLAYLTSFDQLPFFIGLIIFRETTTIPRFVSTIQRLSGKSLDLFFCATESVTGGNVSRVTDHLRFYIDTLNEANAVFINRHARAPNNHAFSIDRGYES